MPDRRRPDPRELAREAERISALPAQPPPPPKRGYGGVPIPPRPELKSSPAHELTRTDGVFQPAPGSAPMPPEKRSFSPPPAASPAEERAIEREAQSEGARVYRAPESRATASATVVRHEYGIDKSTRNWIVAAFLGVGGVGVYGATKPTVPDAPPLEPLSCQQRCPLGNKQPIPRGLPTLELQVTMLCCEIMTARLDSEAALVEAKNAREVAGKASDKATKVETTTPKVNP